MESITLSFFVVSAHPLIDEILAPNRTIFGQLWLGYRNHCLTVYNHVRANLELSEWQDQALAIACAFHDLSLWLEDEFDYIEPSIRRTQDWCADHNHSDKIEVISDMIRYHHKLTDTSLEQLDPLVALFKNADWSALTFGVVPHDRHRAWRKAISQAFPNEGFHRFLLKRTIRHLREGGITNPLPMVRL